MKFTFFKNRTTYSAIDIEGFTHNTIDSKIEFFQKCFSTVQDRVNEQIKDSWSFKAIKTKSDSFYKNKERMLLLNDTIEKDSGFCCIYNPKLKILLAWF